MAVNAPRPAATAVERRNANTSHRNTDRDAVQPRQICRRQRNQSRHAPERSQHAERAAGQRKQEGFGEELTDQPSARRAERAANGELVLPHRRLCQQQIRHVRARHQQQESHGAEQDQQRRASLAGDRVLQRDDHSILEEIIALLARCIVNAPRDRADVPIRLLDGHAVAETPDRGVVVRRPAWVVAVQLGRHPQIHVGRETKSGREHADNGEDAAVNLQVGLREIPRRSEMLPPVAIADENGGAGAFFRVAGAEIPAEDRLNPEDLEKARRNSGNRRARRLRSLPKRTRRRTGTWQSPGSCGFDRESRRSSGRRAAPACLSS